MFSSVFAPANKIENPDTSVNSAQWHLSKEKFTPARSS